MLSHPFRFAIFQVAYLGSVLGCAVGADGAQVPSLGHQQQGIEAHAGGAEHLVAPAPHGQRKTTWTTFDVATRHSKSVLDYDAKCDGVTDDSAAIQAAVNDVAGTGVALSIPACAQPYLVAAPIVLPNNVTIVGADGAVIQSTISPTGIIGGSLFYATPSPSVDGIYLGTIHDDAAVGSASISIDSATPPTPGQWVRLCHGFSTQIFSVVAVTPRGGSTYNVTLDRPVIAPFVANDFVTSYTSIPTNIRIEGNGMKVGGTGDLYVELFACWRCGVRGINFVSDYGSLRSNTFWASFDEGSRDSVFEDLSFDGTGNNVSVSGPAAEAGENIRMRNVQLANLSGNGASLIDCLHCGLENVSTSNATGWGQAIGTQGDSFGSFDSWSDDGQAASCGGTGVGLVVDKSTRTRVRDFAATNCVEASHVYAGAVDAMIDGLTSQGSALNALHNEPDGTTVGHVWAVETTGSGHNVITTTGSLTLEDFDITSGGDAFTGISIDVAGSGSVARNGMITLATPNRVGMVARTGTLTLQGVSVNAPLEYSICLYLKGGATGRFGPSDNFDGCNATTSGSGAAVFDSNL